MRFSDQKKFIDALKIYERKFSSDELKEYKMMVKRHKDDEDLDNITFKKLEDLYTKYHKNRPKPSLDDLFKKN